MVPHFPLLLTSNLLSMIWIYHQFFFLYLALTVASQDSSVELTKLHCTSPEALQGLSQNGVSIVVSVQNEHLKEVSSSIHMAEVWLRKHILAHYPATNITNIMVGHTLLCEKDHEDELHLVLSSVKNLYHSLTRWGLQKDIKVSPSLGSSCFDPNSGTLRVDLSGNFFKPLISLLQDINTPYLVKIASPDDEISDVLLATHLKAMKNLGFLKLDVVINAVVCKPREARVAGRKLAFFESDILDPFAAWPTALAPTHPPLPGGDVSAPPLTHPFAPELSPGVSPESPHYGPHLPPCAPSPDIGGAVHAQAPGGVQSGSSWCVAKPSVPPETLQVSLDYACNEGGADCEAIQPNGNCYFPDSLVAHASYAFNSYWQKTKKNGGTCSFGGTAMLVHSDPSFNHCRYTLI